MVEILSDKRNDSRKYQPILIAFVIILGIIIIKNAWISDDAFITFRTVDNFIHGYGLTWNVGERVQAYTHPLWMFIMSGVYFLTKEIYFSSIIVSIIFSLTAVILVLLISRTSKVIKILFLCALIFSNAFIDYSTSGLENPLSYFLSAIFIGLYFSSENLSKKIFLLSLVSSLCGITRLDSLIIYIPALLYIFLTTRQKNKRIFDVLLGQFPLIVWELFSIIYYGFPFPNTYYAKLNHQIARIELVKQGILYVLETLRTDPITIFIIVIAFVFIFVNFRNASDKRIFFLHGGIFLYIVGIIISGGDFMVGRFFALPFFIMVSSLLFIKINLNTNESLAFIIVVCGLGLISTPITVFGGSTTNDRSITGIVNERGIYFPENGLVNQSRVSLHPYHSMVIDGYDLREESEKSNSSLIVIRESTGMVGFFAGPNVYIIDRYALSDPLLARLPSTINFTWRIGHHARYIPLGYEKTSPATGDFISDPKLRNFNDHLRIITQGKIFTLTRLTEIMKMNLGQYDYLIDSEKYKWMDAKRVDATILPINSSIRNCMNENAIRFSADAGLLLRFSMEQHPDEVAIGMVSDNRNRVILENNGLVVYQIDLNPISLTGVDTRRVIIPPSVKELGFNKIRILPLSVSQNYCVTSLSVK